MSQVSRWFERKFEFTFPVEHYANVCVRLRGTSARLEEMFHQMDRAVLIRKPAEKWSAQEHAGHLLDLEPLWMARVEDFLSDSGTLTVADLNNRKTHEANHNSVEAAHILKQFRAARLRLLERVQGLDVSLFARTLVHPRLKQPMRLVDHLYFVAEHDDHHLAAIWLLLQ
jgi:uncharacterized damage-inducible protein DinB